MLRILNRVVLLCLVVVPLGLPCRVGLAEGLPELRTPKAPPTPRIHGPKVYGARPGHPFLYRIPCTGSRPIHFSAAGLPPSLTIDQATGIVSGSAPATAGDYPVTLTAKNARGTATRSFKIVVGNQLGLTPQMGWNGWYTLYAHPTDTDVRKAADAMLASGMADYGYQFVDLDDGWARKPELSDAARGEPVRNPDGTIRPNGEFPDMASLAAYIHSLGLKAGIYSGPGPLTCAKLEASYGHEASDAQQYAKWGFDLLKYDWCSYTKIAKDRSLPELQKPYILMSSELEKQDRDIVLNMCQYGMGDVWKWGRQVGGTSWRTTGDLGLAKDDALPGFYHIGLANAALDAYAGPGGWNDPDYILIGTVGDAHHSHLSSKPTPLKPEEQYSYMSMWSLMASPLFFSGDMTKLDDFTINVLCNEEVIDIDQDLLGKQAKIVRKNEQELVLAKPLEDGSVAVGLFNLSEGPLTISIDWKDLAKSGNLTVRDVWRQRNVGKFRNSFKSQVAAHDVLLVRLFKS
ncbi:MAG: putative Ig domain-containing protein [Acidobacteriaceae bacterium]